ncbi:MAG: hypothetical protein RhofKO_00190 [Rhodothermales bacterium]
MRTTGKVAGRVVDAATGEPLPGAQIIVEETMQGAVSDIDGNYNIINLKPGSYTVIARMIGFAAVTVEEVNVNIGQTTRVDFEMREEVFEGEEIVVTAEREIVQVDRTTTTSFVDSEQLEALPVQTVQGAINLQAGVVAGRFRGGRSGEVAYLVNGVPINNAFNNSSSFEVEQNMVSQIEVISGVFNAEYGQAMSGVVNIVTKDVPDRWNGTARIYAGGWVSSREQEFVNRLGPAGNGLTVNDFETQNYTYTDAAPFPGQQNFDASIGGPIIPNKLGFQLSGRYFKSDSHLLSRDLFAPSDSSQNLTSGGDPLNWILESTGTGDFVARNSSERISMNGLLVYNFSPTLQLDYNVFVQDSEWRPYNHDAKYVPTGLNTSYGLNQTHILGLRFTIGQKTFGNISYSYLREANQSYLYESPFDDRYARGERRGLDGQFAFDVAGNDLFQSDQLTQTHTVVGSVSSQVNNVHLVKAGFETRLNTLDNVSYGIEKSFRTGFQAQPSPDEFNGDTLLVKPTFFAAYLQDKMEFENLIVNAGIRYDYFDAAYDVPVRWQQAANLYYFPDPNGAPNDSLSNRTPASPKMQISPRLGIAFPISATGVLRFSAGLFFQTPQLFNIYTNPEYEVNPAATTASFGNPDIKPERTLSFEVGFQQGLSDDIGLEMTVFSKDVRNLTARQFERDPNGNFVTRFFNQDFGTIRGFTFSLFQRPGSALSWTLDYTLQFAEGSASDPSQAFDRFQSGQEAIFSLQRLNWDQRHTLNNTITYAPAEGVSISMINQFQSNTPYTTERDFVVSFEQNNADRPSFFTSDVRILYRPPFISADVSLFLEAQNLFDAQPQFGVYGDTGRADESVQLELARRNNVRVGGLNTLDEWFIGQERFGAPRRVSLGLNMRF